MPDIGSLHPQVVHFVVASLFLGLPLYWLAFLPRPRFFRPMATVLLLVGTLAAYAAVRSGSDAHGPVERIPGARDAVVRHEDLGERTRLIFSIVLVLELASLGWAAKARSSSASEESGDAPPAPSGGWVPTALRVAAGAVWIVGALVLFETAEHGGELVYQYAGGVGLRRGVDSDVQRLLLAGLYQQSRLDREAGRSAAAARLVQEMVARFPESTDVQLVSVESLLLDRHDGRAALDALAGLRVAAEDARTLYRKALFAADAYELLQMPDSALAALDRVPERFGDRPAVVQHRERLGG